MIRPYHSADARFLAPIHTAVFPNNSLPPRAFHNHITSLLSAGGRAWIIEQNTPLGYALTIPVPGLPHIADLTGCIAPAHRRRQLGTSLLHHVLHDLQDTAVQQISHKLYDLDGPAAHFLHKNGFYTEHQECLLRREQLSTLPHPAHNASLSITTLPRSSAIDTFATLFSAAFSGLPWDQPYTRQEIAAVLGHPDDILFLTLNDTPIGFAWLHLQTGNRGAKEANDLGAKETNGLGVIEPLGILPAYKGQGYGRFLILSALRELAHRGATRAQIGAWQNNNPAIHLYHSLGFTPHQTITYLAYDLNH